MKARKLIAVALTGLFYLSACTGPAVSEKSSELGGLKQKKYKIDSMMSDKSLLVFAHVKGKKGLVEVKNKQYPENIITTYNVLNDETGKVVYVAELPFSESNDWFIAYKSYFANDGSLVAFQRQNNFLKNKCTPGAALESLTKYYSPNFQLIDSVYSLTDSKKQPLEKDKCVFPYNFPYKIYPTLEELKAEKGIEAF